MYKMRYGGGHQLTAYENKHRHYDTAIAAAKAQVKNDWSMSHLPEAIVLLGNRVVYQCRMAATGFRGGIGFQFKEGDHQPWKWEDGTPV